MQSYSCEVTEYKYRAVGPLYLLSTTFTISCPACISLGISQYVLMIYTHIKTCIDMWFTASPSMTINIYNLSESITITASLHNVHQGHQVI